MPKKEAMQPPDEQPALFKGAYPVFGNITAAPIVARISDPRFRLSGQPCLQQTRTGYARCVAAARKKIRNLFYSVIPGPLFLLPLLGFLLCTGCSSPYLYEWGNYDQWLYENYKNPKSDEELYVDLSALIEKYERRKKPDTKPMAPGLYAEYGFLLMRRGENERAIEYYNKEKALWPEAAVFMDSMIQVAQIADTSSSKSTGEGGGP